MIQDLALDLILVHFFYFQILIRVKMLLFFGVAHNSSDYIDNKNIDILVLGKGPTQGLDKRTI